MDILNQFGVKPVLLAAQVVNFLILLFILKKFMYKPLLKVLETRKQKIADSLKNAEEIEKKLAQVEEQAEKILAKTLKEEQKILDASKEAAAQILDESRKGAADIIQKAYDQALQVSKNEKIKLEQEVREHLADFVVLALQKITGKTISGKTEKDMIEKEIRQLS